MIGRGLGEEGAGVVEPVFALVLNGGYGVGKSTVLDHVGDLLAEAGRPFSLFDVDWFHRSWPPVADDPENVIAEADNLAAVWARYKRGGPRQPVLSGVMTSQADRDRYAAAFGLPVRSVRLEAGHETTVARLTARYGGRREAALTWHLERYEALARRLAEADLDELVVDTDGRTPYAVATTVLGHVGLQGQSS